MHYLGLVPQEAAARLTRGFGPYVANLGTEQSRGYHLCSSRARAVLREFLRRLGSQQPSQVHGGPRTADHNGPVTRKCVERQLESRFFISRLKAKRELVWQTHLLTRQLQNSKHQRQQRLDLSALSLAAHLHRSSHMLKTDRLQTQRTRSLDL